MRIERNENHHSYRCWLTPDEYKTLKIVVSLSAKQNQQAYNQQFEQLTTGQEREFNNTLVLVTPQKRSSVDSNTGIRELARKVVAGEELQRDEEVLPDGFDEIHDQNYQNLRDRVRDKYGTIHTSTGRGLVPQDISVSGNMDFYTATVEAIKPDSSKVRSEIKEAVEEAKGGSEVIVKQVRGEYGVNQPELRPRRNRVQELADEIEQFEIRHIPREANWEADELEEQAFSD